MYGAIIGDIVGSRFEFFPGKIPYNFELLTKESRYTDDTVMTLRVGEALIMHKDVIDVEAIKESVKIAMASFGRTYPMVGYGGNFIRWILDSDHEPYGSYGNGSAMRVSAVGWLYNDLDTILKVAEATAVVSHNHPEGIKGAQTIATAIYLARSSSKKEDIKKYIEDKFGYNLNIKYEDIIGTIPNEEICQTTVPAALFAFLEGESFEDVIRKAVCIGGDTDTIACIAGSVAEAYFGVPEDLKNICLALLDDNLRWMLEDIVSSI